jgi:autotransporter-associated beta strand protein
MRPDWVGRLRYRAVVVLVVVAALATPNPASAQTYTWNQPASGNDWLSASNWLGGGPPNAASNIAIFGNISTGANTVNMSANVTVGELRFDNVNSLSLTPAYTIGSSSQTITFDNGAATTLLTVSGFTQTTQTVAANLSIGTSQPLTINNNGVPGVNTLTIGGGINAAASGAALNVTGASNTTISGVVGGNVGTLTKSGSGLLVLSGTNTYTGGTVITGGTVSVGADNNLGAGTGGVTLDGGTLRFTNAGFGTGRSFTLGAGGGTILVPTGQPPTNPTIGGVISGSGKLTIDGGAYLTLQGNNTYTGATVINNAGVTLNSALAGGTGRLVNTSSVTINGFVGGQIGLLSLDNTGGADSNRVNDAAPVTLNGGLISIVPGVFAAANETFGNLAVRGFGTLYGAQIAGFGGAGSMAFGAVSRADPFSTLYVGGPVFGPGAGASIQVTFTNVSPPGGSGQTINVIPWIGGDRGDSNLSPTGFAETLYTYNANGLFALDSRTTTNFAQITTGAMTAGRNIALTGNPAAVNSPLSILSLVINANSTVSSTISGSSTLTVSSGAIANVQTLIFDGPTLNFGANTGYVYLGNEFYIADVTTIGSVGTSRITGTNGLVVSSNSDDSRNTLYLINKTNANTFSGGLYINGSARVAFDTADTQLGAAGGVISFRGGSLRYTGTGAVTLSTGGVDRPLQMTAAGGGLISVEFGTGVLTVPGLVSGPEQLTVTGPGTLVLANTANTYAGGTAIGDSTLVVAGPGSLGTGDLTLGVTIGTSSFVGGTLKFNSGGTVAANVNHAFSATIDTNGNNVTIAGVVSGAGAMLTKAGTGTLTLSAANTYTGNTLVSAGNLFVTNASGSGTGYGSVTVNSGAGLGGTGTVAGPVTITGGKLIVGPGTGPGTLTLRNATTLNSASTFQAALAGSAAGTGYSQLVIPSGGSINLGTATLNLTLSYTPSSSDLLFLVNNQNATGGLSGTFNGLSQGAQITFPDGTKAQISYQGDVTSMSFSGGNDVVLYNFQPVPEPGSVLGLAALALGGFAWRQRRRTARASMAVPTL